ncbi:tyrosine-type recombinase/integrase [Candidatus Rickettsiella viridis]|nr:site-specific integrase [Candidatus Rickettsiella viridis]
MPGLVKRGNIWHINKKVNGRRISESTGSGSLEEAERYLVRRLEQIRQASVYGIRPKRTFREAATKYLEEKDKSSLHVDAIYLKRLDQYIGDLPLDSIHMDSLRHYIQERTQQGVKRRTINCGLQVVRHILNLAEYEWKDEYNLSWLHKAPKIKLLRETDKREPYPLQLDEQARLLSELPLHLQHMALFAVNTGCRDHEVCHLQWKWEIKISEGSVFIIPAADVKNREKRLVVLNKNALRVIEEVRGEHSDYVFTFRGKPITRMLNSAWKKARARAGLPQVRVHDLKHTFGHRLRSAEVSFEDRQVLLGHKTQSVTTHYSAAELGNLIRAANKVCETGKHLVVLRKSGLVDTSRAKVAQGNLQEIKTSLRLV